MKYAIMILALVGVLARPTAAIAKTGNQMLERCKIPNVCAIYVMGWRNGHDMAVSVAGWVKGSNDIEAILLAAPTNTCIPIEVTNG